MKVRAGRSLPVAVRNRVMLAAWLDGETQTGIAKRWGLSRNQVHASILGTFLRRSPALRSKWSSFVWEYGRRLELFRDLFGDELRRWLVAELVAERLAQVSAERDASAGLEGGSS